MEFNFKRDFMWGASTSSYQVEGGITNNWSEWELKRGLEDSRFSKEEYLSNSKYSCESFKYFKEDVKVLKELGLNAYRFSIEWSRIEPEKGKFNSNGIIYYKNLIKELRKNDIEPIVTLWHWTIPLWLEEEGGVFSKSFIFYFLRYVNYVLKYISSITKYWITVNEPEVYSLMSYLKGIWPPQEKNLFKFLFFYLYIFPKMHKGAYRVIKEYRKDSMVSFAKNSAYFLSKDTKIWNILVRNLIRWFSNFVLIDLVKKELDYIGLNYYFIHIVGLKGIYEGDRNVYDEWFKASSIKDVIFEAYIRYGLPILITENGIPTNEDFKRNRWIDITLDSVSQCVSKGIKVIGYLHWSLLDNFEWSDGFKPKFGLVSVDPVTKKRNIKESGYHYNSVIKEIIKSC